MFLKCSHWAYFTFLLSGIFTYFSQLDSDFCQSLGVEISSFIWMDCLVLLSFSWVKAMVLIPCFFDLNLEWGGRCSYLVCAHHLAIREQSILKSTITWKCSSGQKVQGQKKQKEAWTPWTTSKTFCVSKWPLLLLQIAFLSLCNTHTWTAALYFLLQRFLHTMKEPIRKAVCKTV